MKKFLAILMAILMVLSMATVAFATEVDEGDTGTTPTYSDVSTVTVKKVYKLIGEGTSPKETFTLEQIGNGVVTQSEATSAPNLGRITGTEYIEGAATTAGVTQNITIELPEYTNVGIYTYTLREVDNGTAGVAYHTAYIKLVVTVIEYNGKIRVAAVHTENAGGDKSDTFENTYSAGSLTVSKTVNGLLGDKGKEFEFTVTFTSDKEVKSNVTMTGKNDYVSFTKNGDTYTASETFKLSNGQSVAFGNLPYGVSYTVSETADQNYTTKINGTDSTATTDGKHTTTGRINSATATAAYTNTRDGEVDTGVSLDTLPYVLVLALAGAGLVMMIARKRRVQD